MNDIVTTEQARTTLEEIVKTLYDRMRTDPRWEFARTDPLHYPPCAECKTIVQHYMVKDDIWGTAKVVYMLKHKTCEPPGFLCTTCLADVIDRPLLIVDFTPVPLNMPIFVGALALMATRDTGGME